MVIMETYYSQDRLQELWQHIDQLHLGYLEMEDSPEKLDQRMKLEDCIREFLCIAAHTQKFYFRETSDVLYRSAASKSDFSGYKAATGWNAIQLYAGNLLSQPWRKEYRQVKTYCGFYKHQIEANLVGAEVMFEIMGYKHYSNDTLLLEGPICPDTVANVSKDCLIAYVECQILKAIWEELTPSFKISWLEVLEFRKTHICSPEQSIRALNYQFYEKQYHAQNADNSHKRYQQMGAVPEMTHPHVASSITAHHVPLSGMPPPGYIYGTNNSCANNYATYTHLPYNVPTIQYPHPVMKLPYTNGYYCSNGYSTQQHPTCGHAVPTGQLIELDSQHQGGYATIRHPPTIHDSKKKDEKPTTKSRDTDKNEAHFEDWDYVYRNLESQGYSKDLGERGDILNTPANQRKLKSTNLDEVMHNLTVTDRPLKMDRHENETDTMRKSGERRGSQTSSYENLVKTAKAKTVTREKNLANSAIAVHDSSSSKLGEKDKNKTDKWECKACTYHNDVGKDICEMCSKSRTIVEQQMEIGGPQCSQCTLVNSKDTKSCQACGANLKDSPTYI